MNENIMSKNEKQIQSDSDILSNMLSCTKFSQQINWWCSLFFDFNLFIMTLILILSFVLFDQIFCFIQLLSNFYLTFI
jgi:hypothetical protein